MRVAWKLTFALSVAIFAVLGLHTVWSVDHFIDRLASRHEHDLGVRARLFARNVASVWRVDGEYKARWLADRTDQSLQLEELKWLPLQPEPPEGFVGEPAEWERLHRGRDLEARTSEGLVSLVAYAPVVVDGHTRAVLALREPLDLQRPELQEAIFDRATVALLLMIICGLVVLGGSFRLVGRPLAVLTSQVRRIAEGDLTGRVHVHSTDELGRLGEEINHMTERLIEAQERIRIESEERIAALTQLRHAGRLQLVGQLAAGVAHEMGTPLNVVSGRAKLIARGLVEGEDAQECGRIISQQADRMTQRIQTLLGFARRQSKHHEHLDIRAVLLEADKLLEPMMHKAGVEVSVEGEDEPAVIEGDPSQLEQVLANILTNAMQAMPDGGEIRIALDHPAPCPEAGAASPSGCVHLRIADTGVGMPPEVRERIFEPFFTTKGESKGTGLGMAVSAGIVSEHGGTIRVDSAPGEGTTFHLWLPLAHD
ncbi:MAG: sensor histidine kinase [Myxococcota bacterium]